MMDAFRDAENPPSPSFSAIIHQRGSPTNDWEPDLSAPPRGSIRFRSNSNLDSGQSKSFKLLLLAQGRRLVLVLIHTCVRNERGPKNAAKEEQPLWNESGAFRRQNQTSGFRPYDGCCTSWHAIAILQKWFLVFVIGRKMRRRYRNGCVDASSHFFLCSIPAGSRAVQLLIHRFVYPYEDLPTYDTAVHSQKPYPLYIYWRDVS